MTLNSCKEKKLAAAGIEFHSSSGVGHISIPRRRRSPIVRAKPNVDN